MSFSIQLYKQAGLSEESAFNFNVAQYSIGIIGSLGSWFLVARIGRRTLYLYGLSIMFVLLLAAGGCGAAPRSDASAWGAGSLLLIYAFFYNLTIGSVGYSIISEIPLTRLKNNTVALARCCYNISNIVVGLLMPRILSPKAWNWEAKTGFFWAGACALLFAWAYFRLPEPKGRTYAELDVLFERKVSTRKFASTNTEEFSKGGRELVTVVPMSRIETAKQIHTKHHKE